MKLSDLRKIIKEEIVRIIEADTGIQNLNKASDLDTKKKKDKKPDAGIQNLSQVSKLNKAKSEKEKQDLQQQKLDFEQEKLKFQQQQADDQDREQDQRDAEKEKEAQDQQGKEGEQQKPVNISFTTQGEFYQDTMVGIKNLELSDGKLLDEDEKHYVVLAVEMAKGRVDNDLEKYLRKGKARNVKGKDFKDSDIKAIIKYLKDNELVR